MALTGSCLCGAVTFTAEEVPEAMGACHCGMCRRWAGGPLFAVEAAAVRFEGEDRIGRYRSSDWAERGFCTTCGTNLFYRIVENDHYVMCLGAFDDQERWRFDGQVFIDDKPAYYDFANQTRMMTGAEVFAMYAKPEAEE